MNSSQEPDVPAETRWALERPAPGEFGAVVGVDLYVYPAPPDYVTAHLAEEIGGTIRSRILGDLIEESEDLVLMVKDPIHGKILPLDLHQYTELRRDTRVEIGFSYERKASDNSEAAKAERLERVRRLLG